MLFSAYLKWVCIRTFDSYASTSLQGKTCLICREENNALLHEIQ